MSKRLRKYIASFNFFDKSLIVLFVTTGNISIASFATVIEAPVEMARAGFQSCNFNFYRNCKRTVKNSKKQREKVQQNCYTS